MRLAALLPALLAAGCGAAAPGPGPSPTPSPPAPCAPVQGTPPLTTVLVVKGLDRPVDLQAAGGDRTRLFVAEQDGRIRIVRDGAIVPTPFLDITSRAGASGSEQGLLGLAFHPRYAENGRFFVNYTDRSGDTQIAEFRVSSNPDLADAGSERQVLFVDQPFSNHNGGRLVFGPDGKLYLGLGDGGSGGDPRGNGQNLGTPLGKILRIDVDGGSPFAVPPDNPFVGRSGAFPAVWAYGLRNPWRLVFDPVTGDLVIADVGQDDWEEIDVGLAARRGGENYGWNITEGTHCFPPGSRCDTSGLTLPILEYDHGQGCSITGGVVYRGCRMPGYHGTYFYGDFCSAFIRSLRVENGRAVDLRDWTAELGRGVDGISSFGTDADGEVYVVDYDGEIYRIVPSS